MHRSSAAAEAEVYQLARVSVAGGATVQPTPVGEDAPARRDAQALRVHPSGPLWGRGDLPSSLGVQALERETLADFQDWRQGLERAGLKQARRPLRVAVRDLDWEWLEKDVLELGFGLRAGSYASVLLRELISTVQDRRSAAGLVGSKE